MAEELGVRVCVDDRIANANKSWQDETAVAQEALKTVKDLYLMAEQDQSFNWEMTIISNFALKIMEKAKAFGFKIKANFIGAIGVGENVRRVRNRVENGGHGVDEGIIKFCVNNQFKNIKKLLEFAEKVDFYDNTKNMALVGRFENGKLEIFDKSVSWMSEIENAIRDNELER